MEKERITGASKDFVVCHLKQGGARVFIKKEHITGITEYDDYTNIMLVSGGYLHVNEDAAKVLSMYNLLR